MSFSYSRVETFGKCPFQYKLRYIDKLEVKPNLDSDNALYLGTACHEGIEKRSVDKAVESYKSHYEVITPSNEIEIIKLSEILQKAIRDIPDGEYEHRLSSSDGFIGFIDCLVENEDGSLNLLDFKYSNNVSRYRKSGQVHLYKYYYEKLTGKKIKDLYYVIIPKYDGIELNEGLSDEDIKSKVKEYFSDKEIKFEKIKYDPQKVFDFFNLKNEMDVATEYEKKPTKLCAWCNYYKYCTSDGKDTSELIIKPEEPQPVSLF